MTNPKTAAEILHGRSTTGSFEELKARRRGYPQEPGPDIDTPKAKELRESYDRHNPRYHRYDFKEPLCEMTMPGCTADAAYKTKDNHLYHDGFVQRQIVVEGTTVFIRHYGEGVNGSPDLALQNKVLAPAIFRESVSQMREALQPPGPPSGKWPRYGTP